MFKTFFAVLAAACLLVGLALLVHAPLAAAPDIPAIALVMVLIVLAVFAILAGARRFAVALFAITGAVALSGCTTASTTAMSPITQAIAAQIPHCHVTGAFQVGTGGIAGTGTGVSAANTFDCPAQPYAVTTGAVVAASPTTTP